MYVQLKISLSNKNEQKENGCLKNATNHMTEPIEIKIKSIADVDHVMYILQNRMRNQLMECFNLNP